MYICKYIYVCMYVCIEERAQKLKNKEQIIQLINKQKKYKQVVNTWRNVASLVNKEMQIKTFFWAWWPISIIWATQEAEIGGSHFKASPGKSTGPCLKETKLKQIAAGMAQVVKHLPSKYKARVQTPILPQRIIISIPSPGRMTIIKKTKKWWWECGDIGNFIYCWWQCKLFLQQSKKRTSIWLCFATPEPISIQ
jgi:hypothetical protein